MTLLTVGSYERRGSSVYSEINSDIPGRAAFVCECHLDGKPNAVEDASLITTALNYHSDLSIVLRDLVEWAATMGSWEASCWSAATVLLDRLRDEEENRCEHSLVVVGQAVMNKKQEKNEISLLTALDTAYVALKGLANHHAFEGDAPEFNEGGEPYKACQQIRTAITKAREGGTR